MCLLCLAASLSTQKSNRAISIRCASKLSSESRQVTTHRTFQGRLNVADQSLCFLCSAAIICYLAVRFSCLRTTGMRGEQKFYSTPFDPSAMQYRGNAPQKRICETAHHKFSPTDAVPGFIELELSVPPKKKKPTRASRRREIKGIRPGSAWRASASRYLVHDHIPADIPCSTRGWAILRRAEESFFPFLPSHRA
ncbi:hypothetical protein C8R43DRAFT_1027125 [Mycena crocata]|nr:hypothetical protein C8R43DRAFT_1027125 [Mycena crocata]